MMTVKERNDKMTSKSFLWQKEGNKLLLKSIHTLIGVGMIDLGKVPV